MNYNGEEIIINEYNESILKVLIYALTNSNHDIIESNFIKSMNNNFIKFANELFYISTYKPDIANYIISIGNINAFNFKDLNFHKLCLIFSDYYPKYTKFSREFQDYFINSIIFELNELVTSSIMCDVKFDELYSFLKFTETELMKNNLCDDNFAKALLLNKKELGNDFYKRWIYNHFTEEELKENIKLDLKYLIYKKWSKK